MKILEPLFLTLIFPLCMFGCSSRPSQNLSVSIINRTNVELYTDGLYVTAMDRRGRAASLLSPKQRAFERYAGIRHLPDTVHLYFESNLFPVEVGVSHWVTLEKMANMVPPDGDGTLVFTINPNYKIGVYFQSRAQQDAGVDIPAVIEDYPHQQTEHRLPPEPSTPPPPVPPSNNRWR